MNLTAHLRVLLRMIRTPIRGACLADRLEQFYAPQADTYDEFRAHLLHGREDLWRNLPLPDGGRVVDLGGGTGSNVELIPNRARLASVHVVDLCPSLLRMARERITRQGWSNVHAVEADATTYQPDGPVDVVVFSYSLSMMPNWFRAIDRAHAMLKPGGHVAAVDYYVSRKWPTPGRVRHSGFARWFWPTLFAAGNVFPSPDHLPYLESRFTTVHLDERSGRMPYVPWPAPYYLFIGRK